MKLVTFNLRCLWNGDGINAFCDKRGRMIVEAIRRERPDVIGFQEATVQNVAFLREHLPAYTLRFDRRTSDGPNDPFGEGLCTAYLNDTVSWDNEALFWLSETPSVFASRYPDQSECPRIVQVSRITNRATGEVIRLINNHFDHIAGPAQLRGAEQLVSWIKDAVPCPTVLVGDLNVEPDSPVIALLREQMTDLTDGIPMTFHDFGRLENAMKIDYIFVTADLVDRCGRSVCWTDEQNGVFLSDHYPVCVTIEES